VICIGLLTGILISPLSAQEAKPSPNFQQAIFIDALGQELTSRHYAEKGMEKLIQAGFDTIFLQGRYLGEVFYNSILEPRSSRIDPSYADPLYDFIMMSHSNNLKKPIKVFAWINIFPCHSGVISHIPPVGNIMQRHPEWITENVKGEKMDHNKLYHLDPGIPEVQNYIISMLTEVVHKYSIDGILLDELRYPDDGLNWGYNKLALSAYYNDTGLSEKPLPYDPRWSDWRRKQITSLMEKIHEKIKSIKPDMQIFVGGIDWTPPDSWNSDFKNSPAYSLVFQDWMGWVENGMVDGVVACTYKQAPQQNKEFNQWVEFLVSKKGKGKFICGIGGFFNFTDAIIGQIKTVREKGLDGAALYCLRVPSKDSGDTLFQILPSTAFSPKLFEISKSGITFTSIQTAKPSPTPDLTSPTLSLSQPTTATLAMTPTPTPTLTPYFVIPTISGFPSMPNLNELITPTPVITPIPPTPTSAPGKVPSLKEPAQISEKKTPALAKPGAITPTPLPEIPSSIKQWDNIYLKNGSTIKGKILEEVEGRVTIETSKGFIMTLPVGDIEKIVQYR
jgi:uncharacterized lipoprotein YddW (UPF0748 family)